MGAAAKVRSRRRPRALGRNQLARKAILPFEAGLGNFTTVGMGSPQSNDGVGFTSSLQLGAGYDFDQGAAHGIATYTDGLCCQGPTDAVAGIQAGVGGGFFVSNAGKQDDMLGPFHNLNMSAAAAFTDIAVTVSWGYNTAGAIVGVASFTAGGSVLPLNWAVSTYDTKTFTIPFKHP
jgi:hypothetical protein